MSEFQSEVVVPFGVYGAFMVALHLPIHWWSFAAGFATAWGIGLLALIWLIGQGYDGR